MVKIRKGPKNSYTVTIDVTGSGKAATYIYSGNGAAGVVLDPATGNLNLQAVDGLIKLTFKVKRPGPDKIKFHTWPTTASALYIDGVPAEALTGQFRGHKKPDTDTISIEDVNSDSLSYNYLLWISDSLNVWALDPLIINQ